MNDKNVLESVSSEEFMKEEKKEKEAPQKEKMGVLSYASIFLLIGAILIPSLGSFLNYWIFALRWKKIENGYFILSMVVMYFIGFVIALLNFITSEGKKIPKYVFISYIIVVFSAFIFLLLFAIFSLALFDIFFRLIEGLAL